MTKLKSNTITLLFYFVIGISVGVLFGIFLAWMWFNISLHELINNVLPNIHIENINFDFNETELVNQLNKSFGVIR
jgi:uncharacterized membrane protein